MALIGQYSAFTTSFGLAKKCSCLGASHTIIEWTGMEKCSSCTFFASSVSSSLVVNRFDAFHCQFGPVQYTCMYSRYLTHTATVLVTTHDHCLYLTGCMEISCRPTPSSLLLLWLQAWEISTHSCKLTWFLVCLWFLMSHSLLQRQSCHAALLFVATFQFVIHVYNLSKIKSTCLSVTNFNSSVNYLR